ncbi:MAG: hypothetical protein LBR07_10535 [Puniceicoccales bacterium]|jgi:hypothetical protein|nr:hypothetical protein [Puniceicoccales bacterium]
MSFDAYTFRVLQLAIPGIIVYCLLKRLAPERPETSWQVFLKIFAFSTFSYLAVFLVETVLYWDKKSSLGIFPPQRHWGISEYMDIFSENKCQEYTKQGMGVCQS